MIKRSVAIIMAGLLIGAIALAGCSNGGDTKETSSAAQAETQASTISKSEAQDIALEDAGVPETAAEDLKVTTGEVKGVKAYTVSFKWSGFEYEYSVDMSTGKLVQKIFDGDVVD